MDEENWMDKLTQEEFEEVMQNWLDHAQENSPNHKTFEQWVEENYPELLNK